MPAGARTEGVRADTLDACRSLVLRCHAPGCYRTAGAPMFWSPATLARWSAEAKGKPWFGSELGDVEGLFACAIKCRSPPLRVRTYVRMSRPSHAQASHTHPRGCKYSTIDSFDPKAWLWFLSSYAPLWLMLGLRFEPCGLRVGFILLGFGCAGAVLLLLGRRADERPSNTSLSVVGDGGSEVSGYLAAYLLPFLTVSDPTLDDLLAYGIFISVAGIVYVRSGLMQINPTVYLMGRRVIRARVVDRHGEQEVFVITSRDLRLGAELKAERFSERVYFDHGSQQG
jgi:hypothetical protein